MVEYLEKYNMKKVSNSPANRATSEFPLWSGTSQTGSSSGMKNLKWALPFFAALLPIVLLSVYAYRIASSSLHDVMQAQNVGLANNLSARVSEEFSRALSLAEAVASGTGTIRALNDQDNFALVTRLKALTIAYPQVRRAFITNREGKIQVEYPVSSGESRLLKDADGDWYELLARRWEPIISDVHVHPSNPDDLVVAIAVPVRGAEGKPIGAFVFEYAATTIVQWIWNLELPEDGFLFILDQDGTVVAHSVLTGKKELIREYSRVPEIQEAMAGKFYTAEYIDPLQEQKMIATFLPVTVGGSRWLIVAEKPVSSAYSELRWVRLNIGLAGGFLTLLTLGMIISLGKMSARNIKLNRELEEKNQKLRNVASIVSFSNDAIIGCTLDGIIRSWNTAAQTMYGYSVEEVMGKSLSKLVPAIRIPELMEMLKQIGSGEIVKNVETVRVRKDGAFLPVSLTISPVKDGSGAVIGISSIDRDITERKKIEQMKNDFISFVSHQLKAPVTAIRLTIEMIMDGDYGKLPEALIEPIKQLDSIAVQSGNLISDILNVSRIDRGVIAMDISPVSLKDIVERSLRDYRQSIEKQGLKLVLEGMEQPIIVLADKEKMAEAVTNSISNAMKHTAAGSITVHMHADGEYGYIDVSDTGEGMDAEILSKLFTRDQILGGNAKAERSAGLGLYIARNFMNLQKGDIVVSSTPGKGSTFSYRVPLFKEGQEAADLQKEKEMLQ